MRKKHLAESAAISSNPPLPDRRNEGDWKWEGACPSHPHNCPTPKAHLELPFKPLGAFTLALCTCQLMYTHARAHTHTYTRAHVCHTHPNAWLPFHIMPHLYHHPLLPGSPWPMGPQDQAWHTLAFPGFEKRVMEQEVPQRQVTQSVEYVCLRLRYSTDLMFL